MLTAGTVHIWLPRTFDGTVTAQCFGGLDAELSPRLSQHAVRFKGKRDEYEWNGPEYRQSWRVRMPPDVVEGERQTPGGTGEALSEDEMQFRSSLAKATTVTGKIYIYHPDDLELAESKGSCAIA